MKRIRTRKVRTRDRIGAAALAAIAAAAACTALPDNRNFSDFPAPTGPLAATLRGPGTVGGALGCVGPDGPLVEDGDEIVIDVEGDRVQFTPTCGAARLTATGILSVPGLGAVVIPLAAQIDLSVAGAADCAALAAASPEALALTSDAFVIGVDVDANPTLPASLIECIGRDLALNADASSLEAAFDCSVLELCFFSLVDATLVVTDLAETLIEAARGVAE